MGFRLVPKSVTFKLMTLKAVILRYFTQYGTIWVNYVLSAIKL